MSGTGSIGPTEGLQQPAHHPIGRSTSASEVEKVGAGFSRENTITHAGGRSPLEAGISGLTVNLPLPTRDVSDASFKIQEELDNATGEMASFSIDSIFNQDGDDMSAIDEIIAAVQSGDIDSEEALTARIAEEGLEGMNLEGIMEFEELASDVFIHLSAIESAPPEVKSRIDSLMADAERALSLGNIEDVSAILSRVQTELRDTRIKFDQESVQAAKQARETLHEGRVKKLVEAVKKLEEQEKSGILGKIFGAIATALAMIVGTLLIATGVLSKVGTVLMVASMVLMAAITLSQNTGNWMNKIFGNNEIAQMVAGILWSVISIALSMGASFANAKKGAYDVATQVATTASKLATHAKMAGHLAKIGQAGALATSAAADIHGARSGYEGKTYQASATEDLAEMTKLQQFMDDLLEAIERAIREINEGQEVASNMMQESFKSQSSITKNI